MLNHKKNKGFTRLVIPCLLLISNILIVVKVILFERKLA